MQISKKTLCIFLALVMILGLIPAIAFAAEENVVYLSVSLDTGYIDDKNGNPIAYVPVPMSKIEAIDLAEYGLDNMLFDADCDGAYETTALQLLIYAHEEIYGGDWGEVNFDALPGSSYFRGGIFGFTENLVYFQNGDFPVDETQQSDFMTVGATSDRIVLKAGDFLDVASFSCYNFLWDQAGGFHLFVDKSGNYTHDYIITEGETLSVKLKHSFCDLMYGESWVKDATDYEVYYGTIFGEAEGSVTTDDSGCAEINISDAGTYYVWCNGGNGSDDGFTHTACDYYLETGEPCVVSSPAYAKVTVNKAANTVAVGDRNFTTLEDAFAYQVETGAEYVSLLENVTVKDLQVPVEGVLNLNGYTLTADTFDSTAAAAKIIDTSGGDGLLIAEVECKFAHNNPQLPIEDKTAGGFRFFAVSVESVAVTGKDGTSPKYWFQIKFENFEKVYEMIHSGAELEIKVILTVDETEVLAKADRDFLLRWAENCKTSNGRYITAKLLDAESKAVSVIPAIGANEVHIIGNAL